jgi:hypothetical protein
LYPYLICSLDIYPILHIDLGSELCIHLRFVDVPIKIEWSPTAYFTKESTAYLDKIWQNEACLTETKAWVFLVYPVGACVNLQCSPTTAEYPWTVPNLLVKSPMASRRRFGALNTSGHVGIVSLDAFKRRTSVQSRCDLSSIYSTYIYICVCVYV